MCVASSAVMAVGTGSEMVWEMANISCSLKREVCAKKVSEEQSECCRRSWRAQ